MVSIIQGEELHKGDMKPTEKKLSRQRLWQIAMEDQGLCGCCGSSAISNRKLCAKCAKQKGEHALAKYHNDHHHRERVQKQAKAWILAHPERVKEIQLRHLASKTTTERIVALINKHTRRIEVLKLALEIKTKNA